MRRQGPRPHITKLLVLLTALSAIGQDTDYVPLKEVVASLESGYTVLMGGQAKVKEYLGDEAYDDLLCKNLALLTAGNGCKWHYTENDDPPFDRCDRAREFAKECGMEFRHHTLVWGKESSNPEWLQPNSPEYGNWTEEEKRQIVIDHIQETVTRYKGQTKYYDVVNEALCDCVHRSADANSKPSTCEDYFATDETAKEKCGWSERYQAYLKKNVFWPDVEDYISLSFETAHATDPDALLGLNEYKFESAVGYGNGGFLKEKGIGMYNLTKALKDEGIPITYVGCQAHMDLDYYYDYEGYIESLKEYSQTFTSDLEVEWHFTEITASGVEEEESALPAQDNIIAPTDAYCAEDWDRCNQLAGCCSEDFECFRRDKDYSQCRLHCPDPEEHDNWDCQLEGTFMTPEEQTIQALLYGGLMQACIELGPTVCPAFQVIFFTLG